MSSATAVAFLLGSPAVPVLVAIITPAPGKLEEVERILVESIPAVHEEDGCQKYALHRGKDKLVFVENWRDMDALGAHRSGPGLKLVGERLAGLTEGRPIIEVLEAVPAGDPVKGTV
jgi:quinol monooxygenase YgiN